MGRNFFFGASSIFFFWGASSSTLAFFFFLFSSSLSSFFLFLSKISKADGSLVVVLGLFGAPFGLPRPLIGPLGSLRSTTVPDPSSRREMADM